MQLRNDYLPDYKNCTELEVLNEIISNFVDALMPLLNENLNIQKQRYERQEGKDSSILIRHTRTESRPLVSRYAEMVEQDGTTR